MTEFLKTMLLLNLQGSIVIILLLLLRSVIRKAFSGKWQRNLWFFAAIILILPLWKTVPHPEVETVIIPFDTIINFEYEFEEAASEVNDAYEASKNSNYGLMSISRGEIFAMVWFCGFLVFMVLSFGSYIIFLHKKKKKSFEIVGDTVFNEIKDMLKIKRNIRVRVAADSDSPLLTGCFFPVIYVPKNFVEEGEKLIYIHELTHYKHMDLPMKWLVCIINAVNWFNPLVYFIAKNLIEACELYCDEEVTENMNDEEKKLYMNTILRLVQGKE